MPLTPDIDRHRDALLRLVAMLFVKSGLDDRTTLPQGLRRTVLFYLRPMEAATVRLIAVIAHLLTQSGYRPTRRKARGKPTKPIPKGDKGDRVPTFPLFDRRKSEGTGPPRRNHPRHAPRISFFDGSDAPRPPQPEKPAALPDGLTHAARLARRLAALKAALGDLDKQAKRLLRLQAKHAAEKKPERSPVRAGNPPGHRAKTAWDVDEILRACHQMALATRDAPDTS